MEKRKLIRVSPKGSGFYTARIWRITKGVLKSETGKLRLRLYYKGRHIPHCYSLCDDMPQAEHRMVRWVRYQQYFLGKHYYVHGTEPMIAGDNGALVWTAEGWK